MRKKLINSFDDLEFEPHGLSKIAEMGEEVIRCKTNTIPVKKLREFIGNIGNAIQASGYLKGGKQISVVGYSKLERSTKWGNAFKAGKNSYQVRIDENQPLFYQSPSDINKLIELEG